MHLMIFPGGGNPDDRNKYAKVYRLLAESARRDFGYSTVDDSVRWPGHIRPGQRSGPGLALDSSVSVARAKLAELEKAGERYDILARSFGAHVALQATNDLSLKRLRRLVLWGSPPLWYMWRLFVPELKSTGREARSKGLKVDSTLYPSVVPVEWLIQHTRHRVILATGGLDKVSSTGFHRYLIQLARAGKARVTFRKPVGGVGHEVTGEEPARVVRAYLKTVLG